MDFGDTRGHQRTRPPLVPWRTCDEWAAAQTSEPRPVKLSSEGRPLLAVSRSLRVPAEASSHVLWIACGRLQWRGYRGLGQSVAPVMCLTPHSFLSSWRSEIAKEPCPSCGSVADCGKRGAWLWKQILFWQGCDQNNHGKKRMM